MEMSVTYPSQMSCHGLNAWSVKRIACLFISEPTQLVSEPEEKHHRGKPERNGNGGEISSCHTERILPGVLQVLGTVLFLSPFQTFFHQLNSRKTPTGTALTAGIPIFSFLDATGSPLRM